MDHDNVGITRLTPFMHQKYTASIDHSKNFPFKNIPIGAYDLQFSPHVCNSSINLHTQRQIKPIN